MSDTDVVAEAIYREHWGGEPRWKQDRFHTLHPDDQDEYRRMAQAAINAVRSLDVQRTLAGVSSGTEHKENQQP